MWCVRTCVDDVDESKNQLSDQRNPRNLRNEIQIGSRSDRVPSRVSRVSSRPCSPAPRPHRGHHPGRKAGDLSACPRP